MLLIVLGLVVDAIVGLALGFGLFVITEDEAVRLSTSGCLVLGIELLIMSGLLTEVGDVIVFTPFGDGVRVRRDVLGALDVSVLSLSASLALIDAKYGPGRLMVV